MARKRGSPNVASNTGVRASWPRYEVHIRGHLGDTIRVAFEGFTAQSRDGSTVLTGVLRDQAALHGILAQIEALGLELLEVRRVPPA